MNNYLANAKKLICLIMFLFVSNFAICAFSQGDESPEVGMIKTLSGKVWLHREDKKEEAKKAVELKKGDLLEVEEQGSVTIVYFEGGRKEEYKSRALIEIGTDKSTVKEGSVMSIQESREKEIIMDKPEEHKISRYTDISHAGGQFIRGILPPKQYFED